MEDLTAEEIAFLGMFKDCTFGPEATVVLPSGRKLTGHQMAKLTDGGKMPDPAELAAWDQERAARHDPARQRPTDDVRRDHVAEWRRRSSAQRRHVADDRQPKSPALPLAIAALCIAVMALLLAI